MTSTQTLCLPDVQNFQDSRNIPITRVGVRGITVPVAVQSTGAIQTSVASVCMTVSLPADKKGTHMSRFVALLSENKAPISRSTMIELLNQMLLKLEATEGTIDISFPYFVNKTSPVSNLQSLMNYEVRFIADATAGKQTIKQIITAPITSLCPCSKEISQFGAHNQRSLVTISCELNANMTLEEQIRIAETSGSCELWSRLKRSDEKFVTEFAYTHPKFVEDIVRDMAHQLDQEPRVSAYRVDAENFESIHNHQAYAYIERQK